MTFNVTFAHINLGPRASTKTYNMQGVLDRVKNGGVGTLNELSTIEAKRFLAAQTGIGSFVYSSLAVIWDANRFEKVAAFAYKVMVGGYVGADGVATPQKGDDDRRVGPNRYVLGVVLRDKATGTVFIASTAHLVARADTVAKWRRTLRAASIKLAGYRLNSLAKKYKASGVLVGDMNFRAPLLDWDYLEETQLPALTTFGRYSKYDRAYVWGKAKMVAGSMQTFVRKSDHKGITFVVKFDTTAPVPPVVKPPVTPRPLTPAQRNWKRWYNSLSLRRKRRIRRTDPTRWARMQRRIKRLAGRS